MKSFPIFINLIHKPVLVVGGGDVALRKIDMLLKADAKITVIASKLCTELKDYQKLKKVYQDFCAPIFPEEQFSNPELCFIETSISWPGC